MKKYDLHSHSTASDGSLSPAELINLAKQSSVDCLALTDHDCTDGIVEATQQAKKVGIDFIPGIELSVSWDKFTIHIVGLNINLNSPALVEGTNKLKQYRQWRGEQIALGLDKVGIKGSLAGAKQFCSGNMIGRMHFAHFLIKNGYCKDVRKVFKNYLVKNKPGYIHGQWASLADVVAWINGAGGVAVIAHPGRYPFKNKKLKLLIHEFMEMGGLGIEVISASHGIAEVQRMTALAQEFEMYASLGSDFHNLDASWNKLGRLSPIPEQCTPIWTAW